MKNFRSVFWCFLVFNFVAIYGFAGGGREDLPIIQEALESQNATSYGVYPFENFYIFIDKKDDHIKEHVIQNQSWEPGITSKIKELLQEGDIVIDAGAHIGLHTLTISSQVGSNGKVYAFEPQKKLHNELIANLSLNGIENVIAFNYALSNSEHQAHINVIPNNEGACNIVPNGPGEPIETKRIDDFSDIGPIKLMKIDVEGHELEVLQGAIKTIQQYRPVIIVEIWNYASSIARGLDGAHRPRVFKFLQELGYSIEGIGKDDFLAVPREEVSP